MSGYLCFAHARQAKHTMNTFNDVWLSRPMARSEGRLRSGYLSLWREVRKVWESRSTPAADEQQHADGDERSASLRKILGVDDAFYDSD